MFLIYYCPLSKMLILRQESTMIFGTLILWQTVHLDFPNAAKKQSRPADTGAHENPHTAVKNKECWDTPRVNKADTAISVWSIHRAAVTLSLLLSHAPHVLLRKFSLPTIKLSKSPNFLHLHFFEQPQPITIRGATTGQNHGFFACFSLARWVKGLILVAP